MMIRRRDKQLAELFSYWERCRPGLMEPYSIRFVEAADSLERCEVMRAGLRETIALRFPLKRQAAA